MPIVPDTEDWTWVLERPCPDCGFDAREFPRHRVGDMVRENAMRWQEVLTGPDVEVRRRSDRWSALEYACHVRDVFAVYDERLQRMLAEDGPHYENWDQDATAIEECYGEQDPANVTGQLLAIGAQLAERFDAVDGEQWSRTGFRSDGAAFTVETFARYFIHDPVHHLHDVGA